MAIENLIRRPQIGKKADEDEVKTPMTNIDLKAQMHSEQPEYSRRRPSRRSVIPTLLDSEFLKIRLPKHNTLHSSLLLI